MGKIALLELKESMRQSREKLFQTERIVNSETLMRRGAYVSKKTSKKVIMTRGGKNEWRKNKKKQV